MKDPTQDAQFINYLVRFFAVLKLTDDYEIISAENIKINLCKIYFLKAKVKSQTIIHDE